MHSFLEYLHRKTSQLNPNFDNYERTECQKIVDKKKNKRQKQ